MTDEKPAVVITGASTGIGRATARRLRARGYRVFAGVRTRTDADALRADGLEPLILDVTDHDAIRESAAAVRAALGDGGLAGVVNNAGYGVVAPLECVALDELRRQLNVNVVGAIAVTQAFLPLLRRVSGRIVMLGSPAGRIPLPIIGPYTLSKTALEAATDTLRMELSPSGIHVSLVVPGMIATPMLAKTVANGEKLMELLPAEAARRYETMIRAVLGLFTKPALPPSSPDKVAHVIERILESKHPRARYVVGLDARAQLVLGRLLPRRLLDAAAALAIKGR